MAQPTMYRVKTPNGFNDHPLPAQAREAYEQAKASLQPGEKCSLHACPHSPTQHPGGGKPGSEQPEIWYDCHVDPRAEYQEYVAP